MANAKITALTANTSPLTSDIMVMVDDPAGSALTQKITIANLKTAIASSTCGVAASPTATQTDTITHGLGRIPTTIRIFGIGAFTNNASATPTPFSMGVYAGGSNRCVYMTTAGTSAQASQTSTAFTVFLATSSGNTISGVVQNLTSTTFDIAWTETGTAAAQNYVWEAQ
jgi:hypothetical protein